VRPTRQPPAAMPSIVPLRLLGVTPREYALHPDYPNQQEYLGMDHTIIADCVSRLLVMWTISAYSDGRLCAGLLLCPVVMCQQVR